MDTDCGLNLNLTGDFDAEEILSIIFNLSICYPEYKLCLKPIKRDLSYRIVKWKKAWYKNLEKFYQDNNLIKIDEKTGVKSCDPSSVIIHNNDAKLLKKIIMDAYKKEYPYQSKKSLMSSVNFYLLNLEPRVDSGMVKSGYIRIEERLVK